MEIQKIQILIESLTDNEDYQQELWIAHLCGEQHLLTILQNIHKQHEEIEKFQTQVHELISYQFASDISQILEFFDGYERTVLYLLILGYNIEEISEHCGICKVRIQQVIHTIRKNKYWKNLR